VKSENIYGIGVFRKFTDGKVPSVRLLLGEDKSGI